MGMHNTFIYIHNTFILPKGTLTQIDIEKRAVYRQRSCPLKFIPPNGTLHRIDIGKKTVYGQISSSFGFIPEKEPLTHSTNKKGQITDGDPAL